RPTARDGPLRHARLRGEPPAVLDHDDLPDLDQLHHHFDGLVEHHDDLLRLDDDHVLDLLHHHEHAPDDDAVHDHDDAAVRYDVDHGDPQHDVVHDYDAAAADHHLQHDVDGPRAQHHVEHDDHHGGVDVHDVDQLHQHHDVHPANGPRVRPERHRGAAGRSVRSAADPGHGGGQARPALPGEREHSRHRRRDGRFAPHDRDGDRRDDVLLRPRRQHRRRGRHASHRLRTHGRAHVPAG